MFDGTKVLMPMAGFDGADIFKPTPTPPATNATLRFRIVEVADPPDGSILYIAGVFGVFPQALYAMQLTGDGSLMVLVSGSLYTGAWTPVAGATNEVHLTVDGAGTPSLFIDQVSIPLTFSGFSSFTFMPNNVVLAIGNGHSSGPGAFDCVFVANGVLSPSAEICCEGGETC